MSNKNDGPHSNIGAGIEERILVASCAICLTMLVFDIPGLTGFLPIFVDLYSRLKGLL